MASVNQTRPHCVNKMGKTHSKPFAARHGRATAWARHGNGMLCMNRPLWSQTELHEGKSLMIKLTSRASVRTNNTRMSALAVLLLSRENCVRLSDADPTTHILQEEHILT